MFRINVYVLNNDTQRRRREVFTRGEMMACTACERSILYEHRRRLGSITIWTQSNQPPSHLCFLNFHFTPSDFSNPYTLLLADPTRNHYSLSQGHRGIFDRDSPYPSTKIEIEIATKLKCQLHRNDLDDAHTCLTTTVHNGINRHGTQVT